MFQLQIQKIERALQLDSQECSHHITSVKTQTTKCTGTDDTICVLGFFSFKSYTASFAPVDCSEIPLSFNGFSCVAHNIANATPTSKLHTARMFKTSLACGRFLNFSTTRLACGLLSISCNNTIVRPNILGATSLLQPTKYRSQIRTQYPHSWHGLTLKSCDPHVRKNEVMPVAARHSMP